MTERFEGQTYVDYVYCTEGLRDYSADSAYFDEDYLDSMLATWTPVFEANKRLSAVDIDDSPDFTLMTGFREGEEHEEHAWECDGWRFNCTHINRYGDVWLKFYQKHGEGVMEVKLK